MVSGSVQVRNSHTNLVTLLQAYEYRQGIFAGRIVADRLGLIGFASGAFAAMRREAMDKVQGWDVGPPEDLDSGAKDPQGWV